MDERAQLLRQLLEFSGEPRDILARLLKHPWDPPPGTPSVVVTRDHYRNVLNRYLSDEISSQQLSDWAGGLESREDVGFDPSWAAVLKGLEYRLANPEINEPITKKLVMAMLSELANPMSPSAHEQLDGKEAITFAERHLKKLEVSGLNWKVAYEDPRTGEKWLMDYPNSEAHGGGSPRLWKLPPS